MKYYFLTLSLLLVIFTSCDKGVSKTSDLSSNLYELLFTNPEVKEKLFKTFNIKEGEKAKIFKVIISRRNQFARVTIYQIFYNYELEELPLGVLSYKNDLFLYYNGSELISKNSLNREKINEMLKKRNILLENSSSKIYDSRVMQFDISNDYKVKMNFPAISPFDEETKILWKK